MSRVINTNNPTKIRNQNRRTIAELLQQLGRKASVDEEAKDMAATIVYCLREIHETALSAAKAWEKRDYWIKAERFLRQWEWTLQIAADLEDIIREGAWDLLPRIMMELFPHFTDVQIKSLTRKPTIWRGQYRRLLADPPNTIA